MKRSDIQKIADGVDNLARRFDAISARGDGTKAEAKERKSEWNLALSEGRVIKMGNGNFKSYPTTGRAQEDLKMIRGTGMKAEIVKS